MHKHILPFFLIISSVFLFACHQNFTSEQTVFKADLDTVYNNGSGIQSISLDSEKIHTLTNLGMLWGFLKYYHASVSKGDYNMDAELFRVLPKVLLANNRIEANKIMEQWVDHFGVPDTCKTCVEIRKNDSIKYSIKLMPDYGYLFDTGNLPLTLVSKLDFIKRNRSADSEHYYIGTEGSPVFIHEIEYSSKKYPDAGLRLLALYRYWSMIQYFYPNRHLIGEDWNKVLTEFIPVFCNAKDTLAYEMASLQIIARIHDTHANLWEGGVEIDKMKGDYTAPFKAAFIEDKLVITEFYPDSLPLKYKIQIRDVIEKINDVPLCDLVKQYLPFAPASNYSTQLRELAKPSGFLLRGKTPEMNLQVARNGLLFNVELQRIKFDKKDNSDFPNKIACFNIMEGNIGYIYPQHLVENDLDIIKIKLKDTKGIVIDMRCYPSVFIPYTYGEWLKPVKSAFVRYTVMNVDIPGLCQITEPAYNGCDTGNHYKGKLVIIVNEYTQSQAEFTTMAFSTVPGAIVIGSMTAGADGGVSTIILPGGETTWISGLGVLYPDSTETQRVGIKIDKIVKPTIKVSKYHEWN